MIGFRTELMGRDHNHFSPSHSPATNKTYRSSPLNCSQLNFLPICIIIYMHTNSVHIIHCVG